MFESNEQEGVAGPGTVVGANVKLTGTLSDVNDITVHGTVEGEVISDKTVTIAETAAVKGPVTAQMVSVSGRINGSITAHQKLELLPTAQVNGGITTKELIIKSGATFNGKCTMTEDGNTPNKTDKPTAKEKEEKKALAPAKTQDKSKNYTPDKPVNTKSTKSAEVTTPASAEPTFELED